MTFRIRYTSRARRDIHDAVNWWAENRSHDQAERWFNEIHSAIASRAHDPERFALSPETDLLETDVRELHFGVRGKPTHRVVFTVQSGSVIILRVRHHAQQDLTEDDIAL